LQKQPEHQMVKVLKALTLDRMGKREEAMALADSVRVQGPTDEHTLSTLALVYKVAGKLDELLSMYEAASVHDPTNLEYLRGIFLALVRKQTYARQQQVAPDPHSICPAHWRHWLVVGGRGVEGVTPSVSNVGDGRTQDCSGAVNTIGLV
jgi:tetratricopeptide (TPR) repeat protein